MTVATKDWADLRADLARANVTSRAVALALVPPMRPERFSTLLNSDEETLPTSSFIDRFEAAIERVKAGAA